MNFAKRNDASSDKIANAKMRETYDVDYSIYYTRWFLRFLGIWPLVESVPTRFDRNAAVIVLPLSSILMILLMIPMIAYFRADPDDVSRLLAHLAPLIFQISNVAKHYLMIVRSSTIKYCLKHMRQDWERVENSSDRDFMIKNARFGNRVTKFCILWAYSGSMWYNVISPLFMGTTINESNVTVRSLPYPGAEIYFDLQAKYTYEILLIAINASAFFHYTVTTAISNMAAVLVSHTCGQILIVISRLETLVENSNDGDDDVAIIDKRVKTIVENHVRLLKFARRIERVFSEIFLVEVMEVTLIICLLLYYCITKWSNNDNGSMLMYFLLLFSFTFNLFIYCQVGEILKEQCQEIGKTAYMIEWYKLPRKSTHFVPMVISMGNRLPKLTAGGMMELSIPSFAGILKTSGAYLNMLRSVTVT